MLNYRQVREHHLQQVRRTAPNNGSRIMILGFAAIILIGTILLKLPAATETDAGITWGEALFTATSATTVTGLIVVGTETTFSTFGELVILGLIQIGGIGFITLSVVLFQLIGRRVTIYERSLLTQTLGVIDRQGVVRLTILVFAITVMFEAVGAMFLFSQYLQIMPWSQAAYYAIFHAVSAYCNAGFDLFTSLDDPALIFSRDNVIIIVTFSLLITIGTLGVTVIYDLLTWPQERHLSLHTRLVVPFTIILTILGTLLIVVDESFVRGDALANLPLWERWELAFFTAVSARTAGLTLIPMASLGEASQLLVLIWMFIGGAPASMAGGVGLSTVAVVLVTLVSTVRGHREVRIFERTLPTETVYKAAAVITVSTVVVAGVTLLLMLLDQGAIFTVGFDVVSAYSNTGYSLANTDRYGPISRLILAFTMFWGRLGPLTLVVALAQRRSRTLVRYPEEKIIIG